MKNNSETSKNNKMFFFAIVTLIIIFFAVNIVTLYIEHKLKMKRINTFFEKERESLNIRYNKHEEILEEIKIEEGIKE